MLNQLIEVTQCNEPVKYMHVMSTLYCSNIPLSSTCTNYYYFCEDGSADELSLGKYCLVFKQLIAGTTNDTGTINRYQSCSTGYMGLTSIG